MEGTRSTRRIRVIDGRFQYGAIAVSLTIVPAGLLIFAAGATLSYLLAHPAGDAARPELLH